MFRSRRVNAELVFNFRHRATAIRWVWLNFHFDPTGSWELFRVEAPVIPGWNEVSRKRVASGE